MTPLFVVLILIEFTDIVFALDSIPAIFAVTRDPYIVFSPIYLHNRITFTIFSVNACC
ncbi:MAG: hypothetical protein HC905_14835 [Bacteroidales bacterium]|nr:hypothetical protein [Bacteroidales bacterium]